MDVIRDFTFELTTNMHYSDIPIIRDNIQPQEQPQQDVQFAISNCNKTLLKNKGVKSWEVGFCTWALVHLFGDSHQPLHTSSLFSKRFPNGDQGGNLFKIQYQNLKIKNLHSLWDSQCDHEIDLVRVNFLIQPLNATGLKIVEDHARKLMETNSRESLAEQLKKSFRQGFNDTHQIAQDYVYQNIEPFGTPSQQYLDGCWAICQKQITLAGYRLTDSLISYFS